MRIALILTNITKQRVRDISFLIMSFLVSGEPPLCMSSTVFLALKMCIKEARNELGQSGYFPLGKVSIYLNALLLDITLNSF